jgi:hypothetical protein
VLRASDGPKGKGIELSIDRASLEHPDYMQDGQSRVVEGIEGIEGVYAEHRLSCFPDLDTMLLKRTSSSHQRFVSATSARTGGGELGKHGGVKVLSPLCAHTRHAVSAVSERFKMEKKNTHHLSNKLE